MLSGKSLCTRYSNSTSRDPFRDNCSCVRVGRALIHFFAVDQTLGSCCNMVLWSKASFGRNVCHLANSLATPCQILCCAISLEEHAFPGRKRYAWPFKNWTRSEGASWWSDNSLWNTNSSCLVCKTLLLYGTREKWGNNCLMTYYCGLW